MLATVAAAAHISPGWKTVAVLIGFALLGLLWAWIGLTNTKIGWKVWQLVGGEDGPSSTSKFQWAIWLVVILFAYTVLWVLRAKAGDYSAITTVPRNLLTVLGLSTVTAVAAKGITVGYLQSGRITKASRTQGGQGGILKDDSGYPELAKIQMIGFTFIAVGIFLATLIHQIHTNSLHAGLPNIDSSLLVLMGLSQGGYLGKKLVSVGTSGARSAITAPVDSPTTTTPDSGSAVTAPAASPQGPPATAQ